MKTLHLRCKTNYLLSLFIITIIFSHKTVSAASASFNASDTRFNLHFASDFSNSERQKLQTWLQQAAQAVTTAYGAYPVTTVKVVIDSDLQTNEAVPWAQVWRDKVPTVSFTVNPSYSLEHFQDDWVATHEFSHLLLPYPGQDAIWLSEGLASYYQNVLRARQGMLSDKTAWQKLIEGLQRGQADNRHSQLTLDEISPKMRMTRSFMRVYWSGVAYYLFVDVQLRQASHNQQSLDSVLAQFGRCCYPANGRMDSAALIKKLDEVSQTSFFSQAYTHFASSHQLPNPTPLLNKLGVHLSEGKVRYREATWAGVREAIMAADPP